MEQGHVDSFRKYLLSTAVGKALSLGHRERKISFLFLGNKGVPKESILVFYGQCNKL